jgi:hypothetical protein
MKRIFVASAAIAVAEHQSRAARWFILRQKIPIWEYFLEGLGRENVGIFYGRLV